VSTKKSPAHLKIFKIAEDILENEGQIDGVAIADAV
jgi:hypothetical protein